MSARRHELKCWPEQFHALLVGLKTFEVRRDDRGYAVGDLLHLVEYDPVLADFVRPRAAIERRVTYIVRGGRFGIHRDFVVMGIAPVAR